MLRARSMRTGVTSVPNADSTLALVGNTTRGDSSSSATPQAWIGPAPPNASTVTPRRSSPCSTACIRDGRGHVLVDELVDAGRGVADRQAERGRRPTPARARLAAEVERHVAAEEVAGVEQAEREVGVGDRRARRRRGRSTPGRDRRRRDSGPTFSRPRSSRRARLPPPAPISTRSTDGTDTGNPEPFLKR